MKDINAAEVLTILIDEFMPTLVLLSGLCVIKIQLSFLLCANIAFNSTKYLNHCDYN